MKKRINIALLLAFMVFGISVQSQAISLTVGSGDYYVSVGDHDYLPYAYNAYGGAQFPALSFQSALGDYGMWTSMQPFGQVWRPYVSNDWRPYTQGHWVYTQHGPTWQGYEPWAWAGYHYGNWVFAQQLGWVWVPGYEWHPGRVAWSQGYNSLGWMPMPPTGYDYSRGYLSHIGPQNQFAYYDDDFSIGFSFGSNNDYYYGGPYYDPRYRNMYYNSSYLNIVGLLWTFLNPNDFMNDNYADYYYGGDYARFLFDRRLVRISNRPLDRVIVERVVRQQIPVRQVRTNQIQIDGRQVRIASIEGEEERIRRHANTTVREVIAPAFAEKGKTFKGEKAQNRARLERALKMENAPRRVETVTTEEIVRESKQKLQQKEQKRAQRREEKRQEVAQVERQGRIKERKDRDVKKTGAESPGNRPAEPPGQQRRNERSTEAQENQQRNRPAQQEQEEERRVRPQQQQNRPVPQEDTDEDRRVRPTQQERQRQQQQEQEEEKARRNRPDNRPSPNEEERGNDLNRRSTPRPDADADVKKETERRAPEADAQTTEKQRNEAAQKKAAEDKKAKNKKSKDKDKDKEQNQDDEPPQD